GLYTFRLLFVVFGREEDPYVTEHIHTGRFEGPLVMVWPVGVLAVLSVVGGFLQVPGAWNAVDTWLEPVAASANEAGGGTAVFSGVVAFLLSVAGILVAWRLYYRPSDAPARIRERAPMAARALEHKLYFDEAYDAVFYEPSSRLALLLGRRFEGPTILRPLGGLGRGVQGFS